MYFLKVLFWAVTFSCAFGLYGGVDPRNIYTCKPTNGLRFNGRSSPEQLYDVVMTFPMWSYFVLFWRNESLIWSCFTALSSSASIWQMRSYSNILTRLQSWVFFHWMISQGILFCSIVIGSITRWTCPITACF